MSAEIINIIVEAVSEYVIILVLVLFCIGFVTKLFKP
jgi:hypothetical protein